MMDHAALARVRVRNKKGDCIPVLFRKDRGKDPEITAVFPTLTAEYGHMVCYAHVGQHGSCSFNWYNKTRAATPKEYDDLLSELKGIYENSVCEGDEVYRLVVYRRITPQMREERRKADLEMEKAAEDYCEEYPK